jgi:hypothetical protein
MLPKQHVSVTGATEDQVLAAFFQEMRSRPGQRRSPLWGPQHKGLRPLPGIKSKLQENAALNSLLDPNDEEFSSLSPPGSTP